MMYSNVQIERFFQFFVQPKKRKKLQISKLFVQVTKQALIVCLLGFFVFAGMLGLILHSYQKNKEDIYVLQKVASTTSPSSLEQGIFALNQAILAHSAKWYHKAYGVNLAHQRLLKLLQERLLAHTKQYCVPYMVSLVHDQLLQQLQCEKWHEIFDTLRIYLMLTNRESFHKNAVFEWFSVRREMLAKVLPITDPEISNLLKSLNQKMFENVQLDAHLYEAVLALIQSPAFSQSIYNCISQQLSSKPEVAIAQFASRGVLALLPAIDKVYIPYICTQAGWKDFELCQKHIINSLLKNQHLQVLDLERLKGLIEEAREIYKEVCEVAAKHLWAQIKFRQCYDVSHCLHVFKTLSEELQSVFHFIKRIEKNIFVGNTHQYLDTLDLMSRGASKAKELGVPTPLTDLTITQAPQQTQDAIQENLQALIQCVAELNNSTNKDQACYTFLTNTPAAESVIYKGEVLANTLTNPIDLMYKALITNFKNVIYKHSAEHVNYAWQRDIYSYYMDKIQDRYPFDSFNYHDQLKIEDFIEFFGPAGRVNNFKKAYLEGSKLPISLHAKKLLHFFDQVQMHWFEGGMQPKIAFSITNVTIDTATKHVDLNMLGTEIRISNSNLVPNEFIWSQKASDVAKAAFCNKKNVITSLIYAGPWSWYKLLSLDVIGGNSRRIIKTPISTISFVIHFHSKFFPLRNTVGIPVNLISTILP